MHNGLEYFFFFVSPLSAAYYWLSPPSPANASGSSKQGKRYWFYVFATHKRRLVNSWPSGSGVTRTTCCRTRLLLLHVKKQKPQLSCGNLESQRLKRFYKCCPETDVTVAGDHRWVQISGICVFGKGRSCVSQGHYNSLRSHHSRGVFMSDGLFCWIRFLAKHLGSVYKQNNTEREFVFDLHIN